MSAEKIRVLRSRTLRALVVLGAEEANRIGLWQRLTKAERAEVMKSYKQWIADAKAISRTPDDVAWLLHVLGRRPELTLVVSPEAAP